MRYAFIPKTAITQQLAEHLFEVVTQAPEYYVIEDSRLDEKLELITQYGGQAFETPQELNEVLWEEQ